MTKILTVKSGYDIGWDQNEQILIDHWTTYDNRVEFGSTFQIMDSGFGETGPVPRITSSTVDGSYNDNSVARTVPTPKIEDMARCQIMAILLLPNTRYSWQMKQFKTEMTTQLFPLLTGAGTVTILLWTDRDYVDSYPLF